MSSKLYALVLMLVFIFPVYAEDSKKGVIERVQIYKDGEPNDYRGKAMEITLNTVLEENSKVDFEVEIKTKSGFNHKWKGFLTTRNTYDQPSKIWLRNIYLSLSRHATTEKRKRLETEVVPGNIQSLYIKIIEERLGFFSSENEVIGKHTFYDL
ncbi:MAG: hypothetical protein ACWA5P_04910 [bacterium]